MPLRLKSAPGCSASTRWACHGMPGTACCCCCCCCCCCGIGGSNECSGGGGSNCAGATSCCWLPDASSWGCSCCTGASSRAFDPAGCGARMALGGSAGCVAPPSRLQLNSDAVTAKKARWAADNAGCHRSGSKCRISGSLADSQSQFLHPHMPLAEPAVLTEAVLDTACTPRPAAPRTILCQTSTYAGTGGSGGRSDEPRGKAAPSPRCASRTVVRQVGAFSVPTEQLEATCARGWPNR